MPFDSVNGIPVKHLSWKDIYLLTQQSYSASGNKEKELLSELEQYLKATIEILQKYNKYFCPVGGAGRSGWPKEPPNYIAFRYHGKLQSVHYIESYTVTDNVHDYVTEIPDKQWADFQQYVYTLGPAIVPEKEIKTGNLYRAQRVWAMLDALLTSDTIAHARDITQQRLEKSLD